MNKNVINWKFVSYKRNEKQFGMWRYLTTRTATTAAKRQGATVTQRHHTALLIIFL